MTEVQYQELCRRINAVTEEALGDQRKLPSANKIRPKRLDPDSGPLSVLLTLHGHCPSKKNEWQRGGSGIMFLPADVKAQVQALTLQAMFQWKGDAPVEHPNVTVQFFVCAKRQDKDGMWTTVLDCLQRAGVIVNDNIAHFNGTEIHKPCEFVSEADERVEVLVEKNALSKNQSACDDVAFLINRLEHGAEHCYKAIARLSGAMPPLDAEDSADGGDAGAIMFAEALLAEHQDRKAR